MIDAGLVSCVPREKEVTLWIEMYNEIYKQNMWAPIISVSKTKEDDSTHYVNGFYAKFPKNESGQYAFVDFCKKKRMQY